MYNLGQQTKSTSTEFDLVGNPNEFDDAGRPIGSPVQHIARPEASLHFIQPTPPKTKFTAPKQAAALFTTLVTSKAIAWGIAKATGCTGVFKLAVLKRIFSTNVQSELHHGAILIAAYLYLKKTKHPWSTLPIAIAAQVASQVIPGATESLPKQLARVVLGVGLAHTAQLFFRAGKLSDATDPVNAQQTPANAVSPGR